MTEWEHALQDVNEVRHYFAELAKNTPRIDGEAKRRYMSYAVTFAALAHPLREKIAEEGKKNGSE